MFKPKNTSRLETDGFSKVLLYAHHGFGKTYQTRFYRQKYGPGLIISGEAGLRSVGDVDIDFMPFSSWDGGSDPDKGVYSYRDIARWVSSPEFSKLGYKWIAIDSLTELSERLIEHLEKEYKDDTNKYALWGDYNRAMLGSLKWLRDLPMHVYVTCLAKEEEDGNGVTNYWPLVKGKDTSKHIPAIFDHVLCGFRVTEKAENGVPRVKRYIATDEVAGWHAKVRDPQRRLQPIEPCETGIIDLLAKMTKTDGEKK